MYYFVYRLQYFLNNFIVVLLMYNKLYSLKVYNLVIFDKHIHLCDYHNNQDISVILKTFLLLVCSLFFPPPQALASTDLLP